MKLWMKYLIASAAGLIGALLIPWSDQLLEIFEGISHYSLRMGKYLVFPMVFFSLAISVTQLRRYKKLGSILLRLVITSLAASFVFLLVGMAVTIIFSPDRIPILMQEDLNYPVLNWAEYMNLIIPENLFSLFNSQGNILFPLIALSFLLGYHFFFDKEQAEPAYNLFDSLSRVIYRINHFFVEYAFIPLFFITIFKTAQIRNIVELQLYGQLILILSLSSLVILLVVYPLTLYFLGGRDNPLTHLYGILGPLISALISGDIFFTYGILARHSRENEGIPREAGGLSLPLLALFGRSGTALVASASMLLIIGSYSSLEITLLQVMWVFLFSFLLSFALSAAPRSGVYVMLTLLCKLYGRGLEEGYMLLIPLLSLLSCFSALLDAAVITLLTRITAFREDLIEYVKAPDFI